MKLIIIRTLSCDLCERYDTIFISEKDVKKRVSTSDIGIGTFPLNHKDHERRIYFDEKGKYLGDTIALHKNEIPYNIERHEIEVVEDE